MSEKVNDLLQRTSDATLKGAAIREALVGTRGAGPDGRKYVGYHVVTAAEATAGTVAFTLPFQVEFVQNGDVYTSGTGGKDTTFPVSGASNNIVTATEATNAWTAGDVIYFEAFGHVDV